MKKNEIKGIEFEYKENKYMIVNDTVFFHSNEGWHQLNLIPESLDELVELYNLQKYRLKQIPIQLKNDSTFTTFQYRNKTIFSDGNFVYFYIDNNTIRQIDMDYEVRELKRYLELLGKTS